MGRIIPLRYGNDQVPQSPYPILTLHMPTPDCNPEPQTVETTRPPIELPYTCPLPALSMHPKDRTEPLDRPPYRCTHPKDKTRPLVGCVGRVFDFTVEGSRGPTPMLRHLTFP